MRGRDRWYELSHDRFVQPILRANDSWRAGVQEAERRRQLEAERAKAERAGQEAEEQARQAERARGQARRFRRLSAVLGLVLLLAVGAIVFAFWQRIHALRSVAVLKFNVVLYAE